jgi:hypothetical protein
VDELKERLAALAKGESLRMAAADYTKLFEGELTAGRGPSVLGSELRCTIQFKRMVW